MILLYLLLYFYQIFQKDYLLLRHVVKIKKVKKKVKIIKKRIKTDNNENEEKEEYSEKERKLLEVQEKYKENKIEIGGDYCYEIINNKIDDGRLRGKTNKDDNPAYNRFVENASKSKTFRGKEGKKRK